MPGFLILTSTDLPEAYFLAACLEARGQRLGMVNILARPVSTQLRILARLRRNRGTVYLADLLLARAMDVLHTPARRREARAGVTSFPEVDAQLIDRMRHDRPFLTCRDPHAPPVLEFIRGFDPDYLLLAGAPVLEASVFSLARRATLNRHLGLVPDFRGSDCATWAFALDRPECAGYSIHVVNQRVDGGDVLLRRPVAPAHEPSLARYLGRLQREASDGFVEIIDRLLRGAPLAPVPQTGTGRYFPPAGWSVRRRAERNFARRAARHAVRAA